MRLSTVARVYPAFRDESFKNCRKWLRGKQLDDNAEGLWRVHNKLYDLKNFIDRHPGGADWIEMTENTDITEMFETHHISDKAEKLLTKFYVRDAALPRNYKLTFHEDGFYRTLKRRVVKKLSEADGQENLKDLRALSKTYCDLLLASTILSFVLVSRGINIFSAALAIASLFMLTVISHNFLHQRDNWRMYLVNFTLHNYKDWRSELRKIC
jgi:hypothetical protein